MTVAALAARLGVVTQTAHNWLVAADVPRWASPATVCVDVSDVEVRRLYAVEGWTAAEVAAHLGCGTSIMYARLQGLGVARRPARPRRSSRPADTELRHLYLENGLGLRQLAERFSVNRWPKYCWLKTVTWPTAWTCWSRPCLTFDSIRRSSAGIWSWHGCRPTGRPRDSTNAARRALELVEQGPQLSRHPDVGLARPDSAALMLLRRLAV